MVHPSRSCALVALLACAACGLDLGGELADGNDAASLPLDASTTEDGSSVVPVDASPHPDATAPVDAAPPMNAADALVPPPLDASVPDTAPPPCNGLLCGVVCMQGATDCTACANATIACAASGTCVSGCSACASNPISCYVCDANHANPVAHCEATGAAGNCNGDYPTLSTRHCECGETADCPGEDQACIDDQGFNVCFACGETDMAITTSGQGCRGGGTCDTTTPIPTCH